MRSDKEMIYLPIGWGVFHFPKKEGKGSMNGEGVGGAGVVAYARGGEAVSYISEGREG
jgi:hypothetical protein